MASFATSSLAGGMHTIKAIYAGDGTFIQSTSDPNLQTVTSIELSSSANPSLLGNSVTFSAVVHGSSVTPTGTVTWSDGWTSPVVGGTATHLPVYGLTLGVHTITAAYSGDSNNAAVSGTLVQLVKSSSATTLSSSSNPSHHRDSVTFTAVVSAPAGTPTGAVIFEDGGSLIGIGSLVSGTATFTTSSLLPGVHSVTAVYSGDIEHLGSPSAVIEQTVTGIVLTAAPNPASPSQTVTLSASVVGFNNTPTGTVTFSDGGSSLGTSTLQDGSCTLPVSGLTLGAHTIRAEYSGDNGSNPPDWDTTDLIVMYSSSTTVISSPNPSVFGQNVIFTATVSGDGGLPTGTVTFVDNGGILGARTLTPTPLPGGEGNSVGVATFATSNLSGGMHTIKAIYAGDGNYLRSTSAAYMQTVTSIEVISSANPSPQGDPVTFTAVVIGSSLTPTGTVTFSDGSTSLGTRATRRVRDGHPLSVRVWRWAQAYNHRGLRR